MRRHKLFAHPESTSYPETDPSLSTGSGSYAAAPFALCPSHGDAHVTTANLTQEAPKRPTNVGRLGCCHRRQPFLPPCAAGRSLGERRRTPKRSPAAVALGRRATHTSPATSPDSTTDHTADEATTCGLCCMPAISPRVGSAEQLLRTSAAAFLGFCLFVRKLGVFASYFLLTFSPLICNLRLSYIG